jgi:dienelactone hydrolase
MLSVQKCYETPRVRNAVFVIVWVGMVLSPANAEKITIPWKGDYAHNGETIWSPENRYHKSGLTKNFMNGAPEEHRKVQRDGMLKAELLLPHSGEAVPFVVLMHGCSGATDPVVQRWSHRAAKMLNDEGYGVLILDSFTTRNVQSTCGAPNYHWGIRRVEDAYSALDYLIETKLTKPSDVFVVGRSNGALTAIMIAEDYEVRDHQHRFAGSFAISPTCLGLEKSVFTAPVVIFAGDKDDAVVDVKACEALHERTVSPIRVIEFKGVTHGYEDEGANSVFHGWRMKFDPKAEKYTMATIFQLLKSKDFKGGIEFR